MRYKNIVHITAIILFLNIIGCSTIRTYERTDNISIAEQNISVLVSREYNSGIDEIREQGVSIAKFSGDFRDKDHFQVSILLSPTEHNIEFFYKDKFVDNVVINPSNVKEVRYYNSHERSCMDSSLCKPFYWVALFITWPIWGPIMLITH